MKKSVLIFAGLAIAAPAAGSVHYQNGFIIGGWEDNFGLKVNGRLQPRYEYRSSESAEDTSSFYLRRLRLDFKGHVFDPRLTFRVMPEFSRTANLRDGWINYAFGGSFNLRAGQMTVPFQRQREISGFRQHFTERGEPSETFGVPGGYDIGVMLHGTDSERRWRYAVGIFDGSGRNTKESNSSGNLISGRVSRAITGFLAADESDLARSDPPQVTVGGGLQGATKNELRDWSLGRSDEGEADFLAATADIHLAGKGFSAAFDYYLRRVFPEATGAYTGDGFLVTAGYIFPGGRFEPVLRYSDLYLDRNDASTREKELGAGLNIYHRGNNFKTRFNYFRQDKSGSIDDIYLVELHLSF